MATFYVFSKYNAVFSGLIKDKFLSHKIVKIFQNLKLIHFVGVRIFSKILYYIFITNLSFVHILYIV